MKAYQITVSVGQVGADAAWWQVRASVHANRASNPIPFEDASKDQHRAAKAAGIARSLMGLVESDYDDDRSCDYVDRDTLFLQQSGRAFRWASVGDARPRPSHHAPPVRLLTEGFDEAWPDKERGDVVNIDGCIKISANGAARFGVLDVTRDQALKAQDYGWRIDSDNGKSCRISRP